MDRPLRVVFVIGSLGGGGSERQLLGLLKTIDRERIQPVLYLLDRSGPLLEEVPPDVPAFSFTDDHPAPRRLYPGRVHRMRVRHLARFLCRQATDVVYERTLIATLVAGPAARRAAVPRVSVVVADPEIDLRHSAAKFQWAKRRILQRAYHDAFRVVAVSEDLRRAVKDFFRLPEGKVCTVLNPVDLDRIDRLAAASEPDLDPERFHIVSAGRLQKQKGYGYLIEAVDMLVHRYGHRRIRLHVLGAGPLEERLRDEVSRRELDEFVQFEGFLPNPYGYFRRARLFCLASIYEGMPNVLLEAMACRTPVLATDCPTGPREILADGRCGRLVPPADPAALTVAMDEAIRDYEPWVRRAELGRQRVESEFSLDAATRAFEELLSEADRSGRRMNRHDGQSV
jgi:glycosyltransferase involved in cell wall biosynthesis